MTKYIPFYYDTLGFYQNDKSFMITGQHIAYLTAFLNSSKGMDTEPNIKLRTNSTTPTATIAMEIIAMGGVWRRFSVLVVIELNFVAKIGFNLMQNNKPQILRIINRRFCGLLAAKKNNSMKDEGCRGIWLFQRAKIQVFESNSQHHLQNER